MPVLRDLPLSLVTLQTSGSSALASNTWVVCTTGFDNRSGGNGSQCFWVTFELLCGFSVAPTVNAQIELYLVPGMDGTNAAAVATSFGQNSHLRGVFSVLIAQTAPQRLIMEMIPVMPLSYACYIRNLTGQTISAGWTLKVQPVLQQY